MTATNSSAVPTRRPATARPSAPIAQSPARAPAAQPFDHHEDEFRLNLSDIPVMRESMDVEGLKPTLLSRLFDLVAPIRA